MKEVAFKKMKEVALFTDGSCLGNPGPGGWAAILEYRGHLKELSQGYKLTTNNRMELLAVINGLAVLKESCSVQITTDSQYVKNGMTSWLAGWKRRNWVNSQKKPVKNKDLWQRLDQECSRHKIHWNWVKGHAGHTQNERCDELAKNAALGDGKIPDQGFVS